MTLQQVHVQLKGASGDFELPKQCQVVVSNKLAGLDCEAVFGGVKRGIRNGFRNGNSDKYSKNFPTNGNRYEQGSS